jgi:hypothetical protein
MPRRCIDPRFLDLGTSWRLSTLPRCQVYMWASSLLPPNNRTLKMPTAMSAETWQIFCASYFQKPKSCIKFQPRKLKENNCYNRYCMWLLAPSWSYNIFSIWLQRIFSLHFKIHGIWEYVIYSLVWGSKIKTFLAGCTAKPPHEKHVSPITFATDTRLTPLHR